MTYLLALSLALNAFIVVLFLRAQTQERQERAELLTRIQHPQIIIPPPPQPQEFLVEEDEEFAKVGTINWGGSE